MTMVITVGRSQISLVTGLNVDRYDLLMTVQLTGATRGTVIGGYAGRQAEVCRPIEVCRLTEAQMTALLARNPAIEAIDRSIATDSIVTLPYDAWDEIDLIVECEDCVETPELTEYWGVNEGREWRVHMMLDTKE